MHRSLRLPSPSMVVALAALFISMGGVSYGVATGSINSREIRNNTIRTQDLRNGQVRGKDIRNSTVRGGDVALNTLTGNDVNESTLRPVPAAEVGLSPLAYARVSSTGDVSEASSRGVADGNVIRQGSAIYCFGGLPFGFRTAQVTVDYGDAATGGTPGRSAQVAVGDPRGDCGPGNQLEVTTSAVVGAASTLAPAGFYVWFYG
jgi:hypothetical protein